MKWIPVSYCQHCIENNLTGAGSLYLFLKYRSDGIADKILLKDAAHFLGKSDKTIRRWMQQAQYLNWIGQHEGALFIRGWQYLFDTLHFPKKACYQLRKKDLKCFKIFCYAALISYMAKRTQDKELERLRDSRRKAKVGRSNQVPAWVPMSASAIANTLNIPEETARKYRNLAADKGYFRKRENVRPFHINVRQLKQMRNFGEPDHSLFVKHGVVHKQFPDEVRISKGKIHSPKRFFLKEQFRYRSP